MAGLYPDVPDHRMAWDKDGSTGISVIGGTPTVMTPSENMALNDETYSVVAGGDIVVMFPELRDVTNWYATGAGQAYGTTWQGLWVDTSVDTTNGLNGTWVNRYANPGGWYSAGQPINPGYRYPTAVAAAAGVKAIKFRGNPYAWGTVHLYGVITSGQNPDRLALWHPTSDIQVGAAYFDWGNAIRGTTADRTFRVKNLSTTLSANAITCSVDALTDTTPAVVGQHTLSANATTFAATTSAGTLAPNTISGVMTLRRTTSNSAALSVWALRVNAAAASWS